MAIMFKCGNCNELVEIPGAESGEMAKELAKIVFEHNFPARFEAICSCGSIHKGGPGLGGIRRGGCISFLGLVH